MSGSEHPVPSARATALELEGDAPCDREHYGDRALCRFPQGRFKSLE